MKYRHTKSGDIYRPLGVAVDKSDDLPQKPRLVVIYCPDDQENTLYVREINEFLSMFDPADSEAIVSNSLVMG